MRDFKIEFNAEVVCRPNDIVIPPRVGSWSKGDVRYCETLTRDTFDDAVAWALAHISDADMRPWTAFCGSALKET